MSQHLLDELTLRDLTKPRSQSSEPIQKTELNKGTVGKKTTKNKRSLHIKLSPQLYSKLSLLQLGSERTLTKGDIIDSALEYYFQQAEIQKILSQTSKLIK